MTKISSIQLIALIFLFIFGTSVIVPPGSAAGKDAWLVIVLGALWSCFLAKIYEKLQEIFPGKTLIEYLKLTYGRFFGSLLGILYIAILFILAALILRDIIDFLALMILGQTPDFIIGLVAMLPLAYLINKGTSTIGFIALLVFPLAVFQILSATVVLVPIMEPSNLLPLFEKGFKPVIKGFIVASGWPYGEIIVFTLFLPLLYSSKKIFSSSVKAIALVSLLFIIISLRNHMVLSSGILEKAMYPSLNTFQAIDIPGLGRVDIFIMLVFLSATIVKLAVCYYAAVIGLQQMLELKDYRNLSFAYAILISVHAVGIFDNVMGGIVFGEKIYPYFLVILSLIIPSITLIVAKFKNF